MSYQGRLQTLVDNILRDFIPQSKKGQNDQIVFPMKNILLLFRAGQFNPILLEQLTRVYHKQVSKNPGNQLYVSRQFLVNHLKDPDLSVYNKQESQTLRNLIMGDRKSIDVADLASKQEHKEMLNSSKLKKAISQEDVMKLIAESQLFKDK